MKICPECNKNEIEDKYLFCMDCAKKEKEKREKEKTESFKGIPDLIKENRENTGLIISNLEKLNNNLYALRKISEYFLSEENKALVWDKKKADKKGDFEIKNLK